MAENLHEPLPCQSFLFTQDAAQVCDDEQVMHRAAFPKCAMAHLPTAAGARKFPVNDMLLAVVQ